ncbi:hypothetical protein [Aureimonas glaciei]|uniref:hypothetical protein n=1 Tax=Aureimonas glaciei TaxID=1776957 RepID=UPI00166A046A|nr:hypothetical protein [Aureimonas glaciei]
MFDATAKGSKGEAMLFSGPWETIHAFRTRALRGIGASHALPFHHTVVETNYLTRSV